MIESIHRIDIQNINYVLCSLAFNEKWLPKLDEKVIDYES